MTHSHEPWKVKEQVVGDPDGVAEILDSIGLEIVGAFVAESDGEQYAVGAVQTSDAERIVACVNFLRYIPSSTLELLMQPEKWEFLDYAKDGIMQMAESASKYDGFEEILEEEL